MEAKRLIDYDINREKKNKIRYNFESGSLNYFVIYIG